MRYRLPCWALLLTLLFGLPGRSAAEPLLLASEDALYRLGPHLSYFHDPDARLDLASVRRRHSAGLFVPQGDAKPNYGYVDGAMWFHFRVERHADVGRRWLLVIEYMLLDHVQLYRIDDDGEISHWQSGDRTRFGTRSVAMRYLNFEQTLPARGGADFYLRVESESSMQVPLVIAQASTFLAKIETGQLGLGIYYGILVALLVYNFILYLSLRDRSYLYYIAYVMSFCFMLLCLNGLAFQYLWPNAPDWANRAVLVSIGMALVSMILFADRFLDLSHHLRRGHWALLGMAGACALLGLLGLVAPYGLIVRLQTISVFVVAPTVFACAALILRRYPPARYFLVAWTTLLLGTVVFAAVSLGVLPKTFVTEYAMQFGSAAEMILLSFALAYRINLLKQESTRVLSQAREQLEQHVQTRTADLDAALKRLETANHRLEDYSRRDGLTGCYNRRHMEDLLQRAEREAHDHGAPFAVLMIDADHFKAINDTYGHLAGDDCLRAIVRLIAEPIEAAGGALARYGGEEFAAILPGHDASAARQLAESLRREIARHPIQAENAKIPLTVSIGVSVQHAWGNDSADELLRRADAALYAAKLAGRNRVELATLP